jgi:hypothetical protein
MGEADRRRAAKEFAALSPEKRLGDAPVEAEYAESMKRVVGVLDDIFNFGKKGDERPVGFVLMVFPFGDRSGRCNYMSNGADRHDVVTLMKEMIARFEGQPELKGRA